MRKQYILYIVIAILSLTNILNINNVSALSYSSNVGVGFTFNPTLSVSLSSSDLVIPNLIPGNTLNSNSINVSVATNASHGYTLSATVGDSTHDNSNLTHSNNTNAFSSIAIDADLSSLDEDEDTNIWGYSYKDNTTELSAWSNYNGLSSSTSTTLIDNSNTADSTGSIDFKIGARAGSTQASGIYANTINFIAVSKVAPMSLLDSFIASGAEQLNGYYKMQDMTHDICSNVDIEESELQLIDVRDNKVYWVAKLKDGNCWMTQNLDLDLSHEVVLTSETSDINPESYGTTIYTTDTGYTKDEITGVVSWLPNTIDENDIQRADTIDMIWNGRNATAPGWTDNYNNPYSANPGNRYRYTNSSTYNETMYTSLQDCANTNNNDISGCQHTHFGNYYNWSAAVASNNIENFYSTAENSICPKGWGIPDSANTNYATMLREQKIYDNNNVYQNDGFNIIRTFPLYFMQSGFLSGGSLSGLGQNGRYWGNRRRNLNDAGALEFNNNNIWPEFKYGGRYVYLGFSARCLAK